MFTVNPVFPGITHITDAMGVSFTLIKGEDRAILFDTGYGTEDVSAFVRGLTNKPAEVILSHGHHDHVLGARWFEEARILREDLEEYALRTSETQRRSVMNQAREKGIPVPEDYLTAPGPRICPLELKGKAGAFSFGETDLGSCRVLLFHVPGHTAGSLMLFIPDRSLLLTGDNWNPCTWLWFPCSKPAPVWRDNMLALLKRLEETEGSLPRHALCSHQPMLRDGAEVKAFVEYMTDAVLDSAPPVNMNSPIRTHEVRNDAMGWNLVFDRDKLRAL